MLRSDLLENIGLYDGGCNAVDQDAGGSQLFAKRFGECYNTSFGRAVMRGVRIAFFACDGRYVHNPPILSFDHMRNDKMTAEKNTKQIDFDDLHPFTRRQF